jgi:hypothetical protein
MPGRIAFVGLDRQIHLVDHDGGNPTQLTLSLADNPLMLWGQPELERKAWSWPTWSPDGGSVACFELPDGDDVSGPARVHVLDIDGVRQQELMELSGAVPLYCHWRPDNSGLLVLSQDDDQLRLTYTALEKLGQARILEEGVPLFFCWAPDGRGVLVHTASAPGRGRVVLRDCEGRRPDEILPQEPGNYCAPVVVGEDVAHVERLPSQNRLLRSTIDGTAVRELLRFRGLGAIVPAGEDRMVFSCAPEGEGTPYRGLTLIDGYEQLPLAEDDSLAFMWSEARGELIYARLDTENNCLAWRAVAPGQPPRELLRFWPSRELLFYLHFFDQFVHSHHLVDPTGRHLVFSGHPHCEGPPSGPPKVLVLDIDSGELTELDSGGFACFRPC